MDDTHLERTRAFYDTVATSYAEMIPDTRYESALDLAMIRDFVDLLADGASVLDAGCGTGRMIGHLRGLDATIALTGMDLSPAMLAGARASHPDVPFVEGRLSALPFGDDAFDGLLAWYSIIHTAPHDLGAVFAEFRRVLRPGGLVLLGYQAGVGERSAKAAYGHDVELHAYLHDTPSVQRLLEAAGLVVDARLDRGPRTWERRPQGFVLARLPAAAAA